LWRKENRGDSFWGYKSAVPSENPSCTCIDLLLLNKVSSFLPQSWFRRNVSFSGGDKRTITIAVRKMGIRPSSTVDIVWLFVMKKGSAVPILLSQLPSLILARKGTKWMNSTRMNSWLAISKLHFICSIHIISCFVTFSSEWQFIFPNMSRIIIALNVLFRPILMIPSSLSSRILDIVCNSGSDSSHWGQRVLSDSQMNKMKKPIQNQYLCGRSYHTTTITSFIPVTHISRRTAHRPSNALTFLSLATAFDEK
jgi:hypothetical protein